MSAFPVPANEVDTPRGFFDTNGMQTFRRVPFSGLMLIVAVGCVALSLTACKKPRPKLSNKEAQQERLAWNLDTLVKAYDKSGYTGADWDEPARRALDAFARFRTPSLWRQQPWPQIIATNCVAAVAAGCDDPMIDYLRIRYALAQTNSREVFAEQLCKAAASMQKSSYPSIRKFYASIRAVDQLYSAYGNNVDKSRLSEAGGSLMEHLLDALRDPKIPIGEFYDAAEEGLAKYQWDKDVYGPSFAQVEKLVFQNWPDDARAWLLKAEGNIALAWQARGTGYAKEVTEEGWKVFHKRLAVADDALERAWKLDPKNWQIPSTALDVELGLGKGRANMEMWFERAMMLNPANYEACAKKLHYLKPEWHGSADEMLAFGRECVNSTEWRGAVPLILVEAHSAIAGFLEEAQREDYWKRPDVWPDIELAYERFFASNRNTQPWLHNYAWYAWHCQRWERFNELLPRLGTINYSFFGGQAEFDKMVRVASEHMRKPPADVPVGEGGQKK